MSLLIVGSDAYTGVGGSLLRGAEKEGIAAYLADSAAAYETHKIVRRVWWHLLGRRPFHLRGFSENLVKEARERGVTAVIATGITLTRNRLALRSRAWLKPRVSSAASRPHTHRGVCETI